MKISKKIKQSFLFVTVLGFSVFVLIFVIMCTWIGFDVKSKCFDAQKEYGGTCTESLTSLLVDENRGFRARNSAIWALGQLGNPTALSVLQKYYTGVIPNREPLDQTISQYELKKAINLVSGGKNITVNFWRYNLD